jgi:hypothetical protein
MPQFFLRLKDPQYLSRLQKPEFWERYKEKIIQTLAVELPSYIGNYIANGQFFHSRTGNAVRSFRARKSGPRGVLIYSVSDYLQYLNYGVRKHSMSYLLNAEERIYLAFGKYPYKGKAFIPIPTGLGTIFRRATAKAIREGKWIHPGLPALEFFEKAISSYLNEFVSKNKELILEVAEVTK